MRQNLSPWAFLRKIRGWTNMIVADIPRLSIYCIGIKRYRNRKSMISSVIIFGINRIYVKWTTYGSKKIKKVLKIFGILGNIKTIRKNVSINNLPLQYAKHRIRKRKMDLIEAVYAKILCGGPTSIMKAQCEME